MPGHYEEAGDGYSWVEDPVAAPAPAPAAGLPGLMPVNPQANLFGAANPADVGPPAPATSLVDYNAILENKSIAPEFLQSIPQSIDTSTYDPAAYTQMVGGDETGSGAYSQTYPVIRNLGGNMQAAYDPATGKLQNVYYKDQSKGGYWTPQGQFVPYQSSGGGFGSFLSGMFSGIKDLATSDAVKTLAPMIISGGLGGGAGVGNMLGIGSTAGGALVGAGTAALTGGDVLKGALMGGIGGSAGTQIGDTGISVGDVSKGLNIAKNLESGNILGALSGAASLTDAGSGLGETPIGDTGFTLNDITKNAGLAKALMSGNPQAVMGALTSVAQTASQGADANALIQDYTTPVEQPSTQVAETNLPAINSDVMQQLTAAFSNPTDVSNNPAVQVASTEPAAGLEALTQAQAPSILDSLKSDPYQFVQLLNNPADAQKFIQDNNLTAADIQNATGVSQGMMDYFGLHGADYVAPAAPAEAVAQTPAETPAVSQVATTPAVQEVINQAVAEPTPAPTQTQTPEEIDPLLQIARDNGYNTFAEFKENEDNKYARINGFPDYATAEKFGWNSQAYRVANEPATSVPDVINQAVAEPEKTQTLEQILSPEPAPAETPAETPAVSPVAPTPVETPAEPAKVEEPAPIQPIDQILAPAPAEITEETPAVSPVAPQVKVDSGELFNILDHQGPDAANAYLKEHGITTDMLEQQIGASPEWMAGMGLRGSEYEAPKNIPEEVTQPAQSFDDLLKTIGITSTEPETTTPSNQEILDAIGYTEPEVPAPAETPAEPTSPQAPNLIDQVIAEQQASTEQDKGAIDTQTQDLLNILSGGTDNQPTFEEPEVNPQEVLPPEPEPEPVIQPKEQISPLEQPIVEPEAPPEEPEPPFPEPVIEPEGPTEEPVIDQDEDQISPTEDTVQDFIDRHILEEPEVNPEETPSPTEDTVQDFIDQHVLDQPEDTGEDQISPMAPTEDDVQDFLDRHVLDEQEVYPEEETSPTEEDVLDFLDRHVLDEPVDTGEEATSPTEEDVQDFLDRHVFEEPEVNPEEAPSPDEEDVQDFLDRHILDEPEDETSPSSTEEDVQDFIDRHILDEPPEELEDGESPTEQDVIDYVDEHPEDEEGGDEEEEEEEEEEKTGGGTKPIGGGTKPTPKTTTPVTPGTKPVAQTPKVDTAELKKLLASLMAGQQYLPGIGDVAHIKSDESLFGAIPGTESPASSAQEENYDPVAALLSQGDEEYASGGHVDDLSVEALLQILRS